MHACCYTLLSHHNRADIETNKHLNYHFYESLKKSVYKPAAFFKGILLPLAASGTCTLREATIFASILAKVSLLSSSTIFIVNFDFLSTSDTRSIDDRKQKTVCSAHAHCDPLMRCEFVHTARGHHLRLHSGQGEPVSSTRRSLGLANSGYHSTFDAGNVGYRKQRIICSVHAHCDSLMRREFVHKARGHHIRLHPAKVSQIHPLSAASGLPFPATTVHSLPRTLDLS